MQTSHTSFTLLTESLKRLAAPAPLQQSSPIDNSHTSLGKMMTVRSRASMRQRNIGGLHNSTDHVSKNMHQRLFSKIFYHQFCHLPSSCNLPGLSRACSQVRQSTCLSSRSLWAKPLPLCCHRYRTKPHSGCSARLYTLNGIKTRIV